MLLSLQGNVAQKQTTLKDLCPEDKQRVANLIKELARLVDILEFNLRDM